MIIDFHADPHTAQRFDVPCARTGENLNDWRISYADDVEGIIRMYARDDAGRLVIRDGDGVLEEVRKAIKIVPKPDEELRSMDKTHERLTAQLKAERANDLAQEMRALRARDEPPETPTVPANAGSCRYRLLKITREVFVVLFQAGVTAYEVADHALPDDARIVAANYEDDRIVLTVESATFDPLAAGDRIPEHGPVIFRRWSGDRAYEAPDW